MTTGLIYTRVSSDDQAREGVSPDAQLAECRRYAARQGWVLGDEYQDVMSGKRDDRPAYQRLLADVRAVRGQGKAVAVVVAALDRFGRRLIERVRSREELKALGVPVYSVREGGVVSDLTANILASAAQEESRRMGERIAASLRHLHDNGWKTSWHAPWGYRWRPATAEERADGAPVSVLDADELAAPYVRETFARVADGASVHRVAKWVAGLPESVRGQRVMSYATVHKIVTSSVYNPSERHRWPDLIDADTWDRARRRIRDHRHTPHQASGRYLLTGLVRCPRCGHRMQGRPSRVQFARYACLGTYTGARAADPRCTATVKLASVDQSVLDQVTPLLGIFDSKEGRAALARAWESLRRPPATADLSRSVAKLEQGQARAKKRLADAAICLIDGTLDRDGDELAKATIEEELQGTTAALAELTEQQQPAATLPPFARVLALVGNWRDVLTADDIPARRTLLAELIEHVVPRRVRYGEYHTEIAWTPLGQALTQLFVSGLVAPSA